MAWWKWWDPDKGKGAKPTGNKAGGRNTGANPNTVKKTVVPKKNRGMDGRAR